MSTIDSQGMVTDDTNLNTSASPVSSLPLSDADTHSADKDSIGSLVKDATSQISTLVRAEIKLAKTEITQSAKKAGIGFLFFGAALLILAYSAFFFFFAVAEALAAWFVPRWVAFLTVFVAMLVLVVICAIIGIRRMKKVKAPKETLQSFHKLSTVVPQKKKTPNHTPSPGMFT